MLKTVLVPVEVQAEIDQSNLTTIEKTVIYWIVWRCGITRHKACGLHQRTLDVAIGQRHRMAVIRFIRASRFIHPALQGLYRPARQSIRYTITGVESMDYAVIDHAQHKSDTAACLAWVGVVAFRTVDFGVLFEGVQKAWELFGWDTSRLIAEWGISQIDCYGDRAEIVQKIAGSENKSAAESERIVESFQRFSADPVGGVFRKDGRVYSRVTTLPKEVRGAVVRFGGESAGNVDVSCCYTWILAAEHRQWLLRTGQDLTQVDELLEMIRTRTFYGRIAEMAGMETVDVKRNFQTFCLFGPIGFHPMWHALRSLCPGICRTIEWWRRHEGGATHLAHYLQRAEGSLMTDGVVSWLASKKVPVVQVHDGCYVPQYAVASVVEYLQKRSVQLFGTRCGLSVQVS